MMNRFSMVAGLAIAAGSVVAQPLTLTNPSFEVPGPGGNEIFQGWLNFNGGNIFPALSIDDPTPPINDGDVSLLVFGNFDGNNNTPVIFQSITTPIAPGDEFEASFQVAQTADDLLTPPATAFIALVYIDSDRPDGAVANIIDFQAQVADLPGDPTQFQTLSVSDIAPYDVEEIQILFGYNQPEPTEDVNMDGNIDGADQATGAVFVDSAAVSLISQGNEVPFRGGSFEEIPPFANAYWAFTDFDAGFNFQRLDAAGAGITPFDGDFVASTFGQFNGSANDSVFYQDQAASEGQVWEASIASANVSGDPLEPGVRAFLAIDFVDANGDIIFADADMDGSNDLGGSMQIADDLSPQDVWVESTVTSPAAPAGTERARVTYVFQQDADILPDGAQAQGALRVDGLTFAQAAAGQPCGDQNGDGIFNGADFNAWLANFSAGNSLADVNGDGNLNGADFNAWLAAFGLGANGPLCN